MTEKPIIFSGRQVRAILEGRKTQTRRVLKSQPDDDCGPIFVERFHPSVEDRYGELEPGPEQFGAYSDCGDWGCKLPYEPGDLLWVREAHSLHNTHGQHRDDGQRWGPWGGLPSQISPDGTQIAYYREGFDRCSSHRWRPSIHLPRWASRITLRVTDVRVQRLEDISGEDATAEGVHFEQTHPLDGGRLHPCDGIRALHAFQDFWNSLHGPGAWHANPYVAAYTFERVMP